MSPSSASSISATFSAWASLFILESRAALNHRAMKQVLRRRHCEQRRDFLAAAGLAEDRHVARIAAELRDIVAHPLQRRDQIEHPDVARLGKFVVAEAGEKRVAQRAEAMIDAHRHHVAAPHQIAAVVNQRRARTRHEAAAMQPDHHGPLARVARITGPDVEHEAVLALDDAVGVGVRGEPAPRIDQRRASTRDSAAQWVHS